MKKIFTLIATAMVALCVNAQVDYTYNLDADAKSIDNDILQGIAEKAQTEGKTDYTVEVIIPAAITINMAGVAEDGGAASLKIPDGMAVKFIGAEGEAPTVKPAKSINLAGTHAYVRFEHVVITDGGCQYLFNQSEECAVDEITFTGCVFHDLERSIFRTQGSNSQKYGLISFDNCVGTNLSSGNGYSMVLIGQDKSIVNKLVLTNSTFNTVQRSFIECSKNDISGGILIDHCTIYNAVADGRYLIDANGRNTNITISNTIIGKTLSANSKGVRTAAAINVTENNLRTSDCVFGSNDIKDLPAFETLSSSDVFTDAENGNFTLKIDDEVGDPRWYKNPAGITNATIATAAKVAKYATPNGIVIKTVKGAFNVAGAKLK